MRVTTPLAFAAALVASAFALAESELSVMSYNIRLDIQSDGENRWDNRKQQLAAQILALAPDILGIQEGLPQQVDFLAQNLPGYLYTGVGRDDGKRSGEHSAIYYKSETSTLLVSDTFWLSETPDTPSFGWGAHYRRICTYAHFQAKSSGKTFWIFNTHFDHEVDLARINGASLILERIESLVGPDEPYILMGDLNATPDAAPIRLLSESLQDTRALSLSPPFGSRGTFNGFDHSQPATRRIDYIFIKPHSTAVLAFATHSDLVDQRYLSDHFPVLARLSFAKNKIK